MISVMQGSALLAIKSTMSESDSIIRVGPCGLCKPRNDLRSSFYAQSAATVMCCASRQAGTPTQRPQGDKLLSEFKFEV